MARQRFRYRILPGGRRTIEPVDSVVHVDMGGTVSDIMRDVGTDKRAARFALAHERSAKRPRVSLIERLEKLA